jgi:dihydrofolate synthase/folylpolyglutamate synthase
MNKYFKKYNQAVSYLESIINLDQPDYFKKAKGRSFFLNRFKYFLKILGNPQNNLRFIHVGGTSGKGSVAAMIQSILIQAGYKTGLFTSPFCTTTIEKIKINDLFIAPAEFARLVELIKPSIDRAYKKSPYGRPSYFEIMTALGFLYFKQNHCDYVVLEVGLGGRHDATNIIARAAITVINLIDYDHTDILGQTLSQITREKAAIIKPKTIFFTTAQNRKNVLRILEKTCRIKEAEFNLVPAGQRQYKLAMAGIHQQNNANLAAAVCQRLGLNQVIIRKGLSRAKLPCRFEIIQKKPMIILDGAHNRSKIKTTVGILKNLTYRKLYLIIGLTKERKPQEIFCEIKKLATEIIITRFQTTVKKCYSPLLLAKNINQPGKTKIYLDPNQALDYALKKAKSHDSILVTGSLYLAGELRSRWQSERQILKKRKI